MNDSNSERLLRKYKGFANSVKQMLKQEYKFLAGDKIQDMFIEDLLVEFNKHLKDGWKLDAGQVVWWAAHKNEYPGRNKTIENTKMVPVILSIASQDDLKLRLDGYSAKEIRKCKVARILREAYEQGGVLNQADVSLLIGVSAGTIGKDIRDYQLEQGIVLPYRGTIHDMGPTLTHKKIIIEQFVRNIPTPEIARRTSHSEEACDRYIKGFKKVQKLHGNGIPEENIASELEMSKSLVREYVEIIKNLAEVKKG
jgi:DNA-binding protein Fis